MARDADSEEVLGAEPHARAANITEPVIDADSRTLVVDVTAVSGQAFFTGVQRMVREFCETHRDDVLLVKYDPKSEVFRVLPRLSRLRYRPVTGARGRIRLALKNFYWNASRDFREQGSRRSWIPGPVRNLARSFYEKFLSDSFIEKETTSALQRRPQWHPNEMQTFFLLDIPVSMGHIQGLQNLLVSHLLRTVIYIHDLFPLTHKALFDPVHHPGVRARHLRYLDIVALADEIVCNSDFTRTQYERFTSLVERERAQDIRVVYPPWPQFTTRSDGSSEEVTSSFGEAPVRILAVGALDKRKNLGVLVRALFELLLRGVDAQLVLVAGATSQIHVDFRRLLSEMPSNVMERVHMLSQVSDNRLAELYDRVTVVAVPSLAEGFGLPVVESLVRGCPVVATNGTALVELASMLPVTLVPADDAVAWANALEAASAQPTVTLTRPAEFPADWAEFRNRVF
jgi:glycosyltransferase involved in cell wall biosynthesis